MCKKVLFVLVVISMLLIGCQQSTNEDVLFITIDYTESEQVYRHITIQFMLPHDIGQKSETCIINGFHRDPIITSFNTEDLSDFLNSNVIPTLTEQDEAFPTSDEPALWRIRIITANESIYAAEGYLSFPVYWKELMWHIGVIL